MTYPSGRTVKNDYAVGGGCCNSRLESVKVAVNQTETTIASNLQFNAAGETLSRTLGNGVVETFGYNSRLQLTTVTAVQGLNTLMNFTYDYGSTQNTGRVLSRTDFIQPEHSAEYIYDSIYRLSQTVSANDEWGIKWTFDQWGNRLTQTPQGLLASIPPNPHVSSQTIGYTNNRNTSYTYDAAGNQTNDGSHNYTFNAENQITLMDGGAALGTTGATYVYDGEGRRAKRITSTQTGTESTYYFYGPGGIISEFTTTTGAPLASASDKTQYRTSDKLGSAVLLMASNGTVIENNRTLPYGEQWLSDVSPINKSKFTTYERDSESNLDYAGARYFSHANGRFTGADKGRMNLAVPSSFNRYSYTINDPVNYNDPDGNELVCSAPQAYAYFGDGGPRPVNVTFCFYYIGLGPELKSSIITNEMADDFANRELELPPLSTCGVNPVTNMAGFTAAATGTPGQLRPGRGGSGEFGAPRPANASGLHQGIDIAGRIGTNVYSATVGRVITAGYHEVLGYRVVVDLGNGYTATYAHLQDTMSQYVGVGMMVYAGTVIGQVGQTGNAGGPASESHVHFAMTHNGQFIDPGAFLNSACPEGVGLGPPNRRR